MMNNNFILISMISINYSQIIILTHFKSLKSKQREIFQDMSQKNHSNLKLPQNKTITWNCPTEKLRDIVDKSFFQVLVLLAKRN